jgi:hypothetical protein
MYKTCFECPHIRITSQRGRLSFYCYKLTKMSGTGKRFGISNQGYRPKICQLLKRNKLCKNLWAKLKGGK